MVRNEIERDQVPNAIRADIKGSYSEGTSEIVGVIAFSSGFSNENNTTQDYFGIKAHAGKAGFNSNLIAGENNVGVYAEAGGHTYSDNTIGVYSKANAGGGTTEIGLYGENLNPGGNSLYLVGGPAVSSQPPINLSDESLKHDINNIDNATAILNELQPKTYYMHSPDNRPIAFDDNLQYGLIAQEVQDVLPDIVRPTTVPGIVDSTGFVEGTSVDLLGIQYGALIPILIAGFNEQSVVVGEQAQIIEDQEGTINELENQIAELSASLGQLQESVAQLNAAVQQNQAKSNDCCEKISNLMGDSGKLGKQSSLEVTMPRILQG